MKTEGRLHRLRNSNARAVLVLASQGISAISALLLELVAARELGASGLGTFTVLWAVLVLYNSAQTGWLGDSLTVLPRFEPRVRRALFRYQWMVLVLAFVVGSAAAIAVNAGDARTAALFGIALTAWVAEETGRRLFLARLEFAELLLNDAIYAVVATVVALSFLSSNKPYSLDNLFIAMIAGSVASIVAALIRLPKDEFRRPAPGDACMREVASFGAYRAAQISVRPLALLAMGWLVLAGAGADAVGRLEVGRLIIAPAITLVNGAGAALLTLFRNELNLEQEGVPGHVGGMRKLLIQSTVLLGIGTAVYAAVALSLATRLADFLTNGQFAVNTLAVLSWGIFTIMWGLGMPAGNAAVAQGRAKEAFWIRLADSAVGLAFAGAFVILAPRWAPPLGLAIGASVGVVWLWMVVLHDTDRVEAAVAVRT